MEALTAYRDVTARQIALANAELERLPAVAEIWRHWDALLRGFHPPSELAAWEAETANTISELKLAEAARQSQLADQQIRLENLEARASQVPEESQARPVLAEIREAINRLNTDLAASERQISADLRLAQRFLDETLRSARPTGAISWFPTVFSWRATWSTGPCRMN